MTKIELLARIIALEARIAALEANPYRLYPTVPVPQWSPTWPAPTWPYVVTCDAVRTEA
jgi:hypothetical protein